MKPSILLFFFVGLLLFLFILSLAYGSVPLSLAELWQVALGGGNEQAHLIVWELRLPRALTAVFAGAGLALGGLALQGLFHNPLAGPSVLGIASGASLGVAGAIFLGASFAFTQVSAAMLGAALVGVLLLLVAEKLADRVSLLLVGLMVSFLAGALITLLQFFSRAEEVQSFALWSFGSLGSTSLAEAGWLAGVVLFSFFLLFFQTQALNLLRFGEAYATSMGVSLRQARRYVILGTSLLVGIITAFCGPIAFVGLATPHLVRMLFKREDFYFLFPRVALFGALVLLFCDFVARLPGTSTSLPLNTVTSIFGAPVVIFLLLSNKRV